MARRSRGSSGATPAATSAGTAAPVPYTWLAPQRPNHDPSSSCERHSHSMPRSSAAPWRPSDGEHLDHVGGDVGAGGIDHLAEVAERQPPAELAGVVDVERRPAAVAALHAERPRDPPIDGGPQRRRLGVGDAQQGEHDLARVVDVGVVVVVELEGPAARREVRAAHGPVAGDADLLVEQPARRPHDGGRRRPPRRRRRGPAPPSAVSHTGDWHASSRRVPSSCTVKASSPANPACMTGCVEGPAEQRQRDHRVHPRRLDAAPGAVGLLALRRSSARPGRGLAAAAGGRAGARSGAAPGRAARTGRPTCATRPRRRRGRRPTNSSSRSNGSGTHRAMGADDGQRHDGLAGPAGEVVDVERAPSAAAA